MKTLTEIIKRSTDPEVKSAITQTWAEMPPSHEINPTVEQMRLAGENGETWANIHTCVFAGAEAANTYLEVGSRRGHSFLAALTANPKLNATAADIWSCGVYGGEENTRALLEQTVAKVKPGIKFSVVEGDSKITLPQLLSQGKRYDLIVVDGDHDSEPAAIDLQNADSLLDDGGIIIFDDVVHPLYPGLKQVWEDFKAKRPLWEFHYFEWNVGTGIGIKHLSEK
jgi:hypothetical protein